MTTVELIAELHKIKESMCDAVRHVPEFTAVQQNTRVTNHISRGQQVQFLASVGPTWTDVGNATKQFECIIKTCGKGNTFDIEIKKFELREKIPITQGKSLAPQILNANANHDKLNLLSKDIISDLFDCSNNKKIAEYDSVIDLCNSAFSSISSADYYPFVEKVIHWGFDGVYNSSNIERLQLIIDTRKSRDTQATALHTRLTTLIDMIPVKKVYAEKVVVKELTPPLQVVKKELKPTTQTPQPMPEELKPTTQTPQPMPQSITPPQELKPLTSTLLLNPKTKIHQISLENYEIRALKQSDCLLQINNLSEFANVQFYFHKSQYNELYLHYKGHAQYLIGNDHKLYVINGVRLVQGSHYDKLQCWTL